MYVNYTLAYVSKLLYSLRKYTYHFVGYIVASASKVEILFKPLHPCRTSQICIRNLHCNASGAIKWLYPNSSEITSTVTAAKTISGNNKNCYLL